MMETKLIHDGETYVIFIENHTDEEIFISDIVLYKTGEIVTNKWFKSGTIYNYKEEINQEIPDEDFQSLKNDILSALK